MHSHTAECLLTSDTSQGRQARQSYTSDPFQRVFEDLMRATRQRRSQPIAIRVKTRAGQTDNGPS